ncbi:MAG TPA: sulfotransferase [Sphingomicrobium sp.]|nr:sulfotransferase [Sphingomicrobium sp.]
MRKTFDVRAREAALHGQLGQYDRQVSLYESLTAEAPDHPALWMSFGNALKTVGRTEDAVAAVRRAIDIEPTFGEAYWTLANFKAFRFTDRDVARMRKALRGKLGHADRLHFDFALGKAFEDRGEFSRSFQHYAAGNRVRSAAMKPEQMRITNFVDHLIATYNRDLFERHSGAGREERDPIFIVGPQRSGSTLIEQILSCHPMIEGAGELPVMQHIWERIARIAAISARNPFGDIAQWDSAVFGDLGAEYLERTRPFRLTARPLFIDKLPANWLNVGLIRLALPNARVIDARRHPMACGFSNFKQHYATGVSFAYSLEAIGLFYRDYLRFMTHIDTLQPGSVHRVLNERLIEDPEGETKRLLDYLDVPFDPACLAFHRSTRAVATPSADQVRRPINRDGVDYWRQYRRWLGPLERSLGPALTDWNKYL